MYGGFTTERHERLRDQVRSSAKAEVRPLVAEMEAARSVHAGLSRLIARQGLDSARLAMEIHAACGLFTDRPIERLVRDAHHIYAPVGTSDVQRLRLAETAPGVGKGEQWSVRFGSGTAGSAAA